MTEIFPEFWTKLSKISRENLAKFREEFSSKFITKRIQIWEIDSKTHEIFQWIEETIPLILRIILYEFHNTSESINLRITEEILFNFFSEFWK